MTQQIQAHAIDIEKCTECPYVSEHTRDTQTAQCTHPLRMGFEQLAVHVHAAPPKHCPHRAQMTLLRVTSPVPSRKERRHLKAVQ